MRSLSPRRSRKSVNAELAGLERAAVRLPVVAGGVADDGVLGRARRAAHRTPRRSPGPRRRPAPARAPRWCRAARAHSSRRRPDPADLVVEVPRVDARRRGRRRTRRRRPCPGRAPEEVDLQPALRSVPVAQQHDRAGVPGLARAPWSRRRTPGRSPPAARAAGASGPLSRPRRPSRPRRARPAAARDADRGARVAAGVAEHLADELRGAVGDLRLPGELRGGGDEDDELHDPSDLLERHLGPDRGEGVERALLGALDGLLRCDRAARPCRS